MHISGARCTEPVKARAAPLTLRHTQQRPQQLGLLLADQPAGVAQNRCNAESRTCATSRASVVTPGQQHLALAQPQHRGVEQCLRAIPGQPRLMIDRLGQLLVHLGESRYPYAAAISA